MEPPISIKPKYMTLAQQERLIQDFTYYVQTAPTESTYPLYYVENLALVPSFVNAYICWHAGFRGYKLSRYGKGRFLTLFVALTTGVSGRLYCEVESYADMLKPFRRESALYHGLNFAAWHQLAYATTTSGGLFMTFLFASRTGILLVPQTKFILGVPVDSFQRMFSDIKPFRKLMLSSWALGTMFMFGLGVYSYNQSCRVLRERFNRQTMGLDESA